MFEYEEFECGEFECGELLNCIRVDGCCVDIRIGLKIVQ